MKVWYYLVAGTEEPIGPFSSDELRLMLKSQKIDKNTRIWKEGMTQWEPISEVAAFIKTEILKLHVLPPKLSKPTLEDPGSGS